MKKLLGIAALILACTPFAQAQGLPGHEDARNDRRMESYDHEPMARHDHGGAKHTRHVTQRHQEKRHHDADQAK